MPHVTSHAWATKLNANDSTQKEELGILRTEWNTTDACFKTYKYVSVAADTTVANGTALTYTDTLGHVASSDISDGDINQVAGVGTGAITASYYGWIQVKGYHSAVLTNGDDDIADGDSIILDSSTNGTVNSTASGTAPVSTLVGVAVAADVDASDTVATMLLIA